LSQLVFISNNQPVTDSLIVSETFGKRHDRVLQDIRSLNCSTQFSLHNFVESIYTNERGREYPKITMTEQGFTLLVMGYTGERAMEFKEKYINEFHVMREQLNSPRVLSPEDQLKASMKLSLETSEEVTEVKERVFGLEERFDNELTLDHGQSVALNHAVKKRIEKLWEDGITGTLETKKQLYAKSYNQMKRAFQAPTYREVKKKDFDEVISWVSAWRPL